MDANNRIKVIFGYLVILEILDIFSNTVLGYKKVFNIAKQEVFIN
jgi:hypothetical protein